MKQKRSTYVFRLLFIKYNGLLKKKVWKKNGKGKDVKHLPVPTLLRRNFSLKRKKKTKKKSKEN